jgi:serine/threonine-protein kinase
MSGAGVGRTGGDEGARDPLVGRIVGAYRILVRLDEVGGMGSYLAEHVHLDRRVLLKLFQPLEGGDRGALGRAVDQARELSSLKHENVMPLVEIAECGDGFLYVVLELSGATALPTRMAARGPVAWSEARAIGLQMTAALRAAEVAGLASTELRAGQVYLLETATGTPRVRIDLATPEALGWRAPVRPPAHVHAVGRLLYFLLTGQEPGGAANELPADLMLGWPELEIPSNAEALVMRALDPEPAQRWGDLAALYRELGGRDEGAEVGTSTRRTTPPAARTGELDFDDGDVSFGRGAFGRPSRRALVAGAVGVGVAAALAILMVVNREPASPTTEIAAPPSSAPATRPSSSVSPPPAPSPPVGAIPSSAVAEPAAPPSIPGAAAAGNIAPGEAAPEVAPGIGAVANAGATTAPPSAARGTAASPPASQVSPSGVAATAGARTLAVDAPAPSSASAGNVAALPATAPRPEPTVAEAAACAVSLGSIPWSDVWVDGQRAGFTPLTNFGVSCGAHEILFKSVERGLERRINLNVRPGEKVKRIVDLVEAKATIAPPAPSPATARACRLSLGSRPWSEVWIDGRRVGITPMVDLAVACGTHDVLFLSREANVQRRETISVAAGQPVKKVVTLLDGE